MSLFFFFFFFYLFILFKGKVLWNNKKLLKYMERDYLISIMVNIFWRDINILNYVIKNLVKKKKKKKKKKKRFINRYIELDIHRIPSTFPIEILKEYTSKIFKSKWKII